MSVSNYCSWSYPWPRRRSHRPRQRIVPRRTGSLHPSFSSSQPLPFRRLIWPRTPFSWWTALPTTPLTGPSTTTHPPQMVPPSPGTCPMFESNATCWTTPPERKLFSPSSPFKMCPGTSCGTVLWRNVLPSRGELAVRGWGYRKSCWRGVVTLTTMWQGIKPWKMVI